MRKFSIILSAVAVWWLLSLQCAPTMPPVLPYVSETVAILTAGSCEAVEEPEYEIGVGDVLSVVTRDRPDLTGTFIVTPEGTIALPLLGDVKATGLTPSQLSKDLTRRLAVFQVHETVVTVAGYNSRKIFVIGEVSKPGKYTFSVIPSIWDVLSEAGGPTASALLSAVQVIRAGTGETITVDVRRFLSGDTREQVKLQAGDTIRVPSRVSASSEGYIIYVLGEVKTSGSYEVALVKDLVGAVVASGGPTETADLRNVTIVRRTGTASTVFTVNLEGFLKEGLISGNPDLRPGDTITVPRKRTTLGTIFSLAGLATIMSVVASVAIITTK